jgi:trk system potassium uptake protein TrkA
MKQFAVIGMGRFGTSVATTLHEMGNDVLVIDMNEERIEDIIDKVTYGVQADATDEKAMKDVGLRNVDVVVIAIASNIQASILATLNAKELGVKHVYAKAKNEQHRKVLYKIGADRVFSPEKEMGRKVAQILVSDNIFEIMELDTNHSIIEIRVLKKWVNKSLAEIDFRAKFGINILAIKRGEELNVSPFAEDVLHKDDILLIIGDNAAIKKLKLNEE